MRADAERNRQRILDAARTLFAERGLDVSIADIAGAAGVGIGTVYRRFPDRDALVEALFEEKLAEIVRTAQAALEVEDPWEAFRTFVLAVARMQASDLGLRDVLMSTDRGHERVATVRETIRPLAAQIVGRARDAGVLREDFGVFDVPMLHQAVVAIAGLTRHVAPDYYERILAILVDGLAARRDGVTPMPAPALTVEQFTRVMAGS
jgi:AcrR family transcriptional regulator